MKSIKEYVLESGKTSMGETYLEKEDISIDTLKSAKPGKNWRNCSMIIAFLQKDSSESQTIVKLKTNEWLTVTSKPEWGKKYSDEEMLKAIQNDFEYIKLFAL